MSVVIVKPAGITVWLILLIGLISAIFTSDTNLAYTLTVSISLAIIIWVLSSASIARDMENNGELNIFLNAIYEDKMVPRFLIKMFASGKV
jgi:hypothetical protein